METDDAARRAREALISLGLFPWGSETNALIRSGDLDHIYPMQVALHALRNADVPVDNLSAISTVAAVPTMIVHASAPRSPFQNVARAIHHIARICTHYRSKKAKIDSLEEQLQHQLLLKEQGEQSHKQERYELGKQNKNLLIENSQLYARIRKLEDNLREAKKELCKAVHSTADEALAAVNWGDAYLTGMQQEMQHEDTSQRLKKQIAEAQKRSKIVTF